MKKQIFEAQKAKDNDLYNLLKSQWAHRFGVESLEELENLDKEQFNQSDKNDDYEKIDLTKDFVFENEIGVSLKEKDKEEKEFINQNERGKESNPVGNKESFQIKSYEIVDKKNFQNNSKDQETERSKINEIQSLIPLPPKPKYSYLKKWLSVNNI